jgi:hypothetical protein
MGVVQERQGNEAELARVWVEGRARVLCAVERSFPAAGSVVVEAAVDQAWVELYERGDAGSPERLLARWRGLAYLRALNGLRGRRRHFIDSVTLEELDEANVLSKDDLVGSAELASRAEARVQEILRQVSGDAQRWLEVVIDRPEAPPREVARTLGWDGEKLKSVARRTRRRLREFVAARASGVICARRQAVMEAFAVTQLAQQDAAHVAQLAEHSLLGSELYEQVALHIAGCEECERAWRKAQGKLLRPRLVLVPVGVYGKLVGGGGSALAAGRRVFGSLVRSLSDLRLRVGSSIGRATAGGAAGTAGTAGALAGKGAAVCVGVLCAAGAGTAAFVGLPPSIIPHQATSHAHHRAVVARSGRNTDRLSSPVASTVGVTDSKTAAQSEASSTRTSASSQSSETAHTVRKSTRPVTPGALIATSSATSASKTESQPSARAASASTSGPASQPEVSTEYAASGGSSSSRSSSSSTHGTCVPGSLSC